MEKSGKPRTYDCCAYKGCPNGRFTTQSRLYRFPKQNDPRLEIWIVNSGSERLKHLAASSLRSCGLCEEHFGTECFVIGTRNLLPDAVPKVFIEPLCVSGSLDLVGTAAVENVSMNSEDGEEVSTTACIEPSLLAEPMPLMPDAPADSSQNPSSTSAARIPTGRPENSVATEDSRHIRKYKKVALNFTESDDENCTWQNLEPAEMSFAPSDRTDRIEHLQQLIDSLRQQLGRTKKANTTLKRKLLMSQRLSEKQRHKLKRASARKKKLARKAEKESIDVFLDRHECTEPASRAMVKLQLRRKKTPYSNEEKDLAKLFYYHSAAAYTRLRQAGCSLPAETTVRNWVSEVDLKPGFCDFIFEKLAVKLAHLPPDERVCAVKFDEMTIRNFEEYCSKFDCIEGLVDLGPLGRRDERARYLFLFCVDSLNAKNPWRQPLAYFLPGTGMKASEIYALLNECLCRLNNAGAQVALITCDQGPSNQSLFKNFLKASEEKPLITIGEKTVLASYDFPHLIKRLLSLLRTYKLLYWKGEIIVNYQDFIDTWEYDNASTTSNLLAYITKAHLFPSSFEAMNVKRAFQILSHTYAAAISTAGNDPQGLQSKTWRASADFAERMNKVIDACNAYKIRNANPAKRPLAARNPEIEKIMIDFVEWSTDWTVLTTTKTPTMKKLPCLKGLPLTVNAILLAHRRIQITYPEFELAAALCNQDSVEHMFSKLRQRGGHNPNPTARMVRLSLRHILSTGYIGSGSNGNVQCPEATALIDPSTMVARKFDRVDDLADPIEHDRNEDFIEVEEAAEILLCRDIEAETATISRSPDVSDYSLYEQNAISYFAGYVAQRQMRKCPCDKCRNDILKTPMEERSPAEKYIEFREYEHDDVDAPCVTWLSRPTEKFVQVVAVQLQAFSTLFKKYWAINGILSHLCSEIVRITTQSRPDWFDEHHECREHRVELLHFMIRVKLFAQTKFNNRDNLIQRSVRRTINQSKKLKKLQGV